MGDRDWRPFIYGGLASIVAEFGKETINFLPVEHNLKIVISPGTVSFYIPILNKTIW